MDVRRNEKSDRVANRGGGSGVKGGRKDLTAAEKMPSIPSHSEALRKCLEENRGDKAKCKTKIDAFNSSNSAAPMTEPLTPMRLKGGSLTDV